jgi:putative transposase
MAKNVRTPHSGMSFVTAATRDRRPLFETGRVADLMVETLLHYRKLGHYKLHAYVVMPSQLHLLLTPQSIALAHAIELIKNGFAYRMDSELPIWEHSFTAYSVANIHDLELVRTYLHQIPVRAKLVSTPELYPYSSAYRRATVEAIPTPMLTNPLLGLH